MQKKFFPFNKGNIVALKWLFIYFVTQAAVSVWAKEQHHFENKVDILKDILYILKKISYTK